MFNQLSDIEVDVYVYFFKIFVWLLEFRWLNFRWLNLMDPLFANANHKKISEHITG